MTAGPNPTTAPSKRNKQKWIKGQHLYQYLALHRLFLPIPNLIITSSTDCEAWQHSQLSTPNGCGGNAHRDRPQPRSLHTFASLWEMFLIHFTSFIILYLLVLRVG